MRYFFLTLFIIVAAVLGLGNISHALTVSPVKLEIEGDPGDTLTGELELFNEQNEIKTFYVSFENFEARGESGTPYFIGCDKGLCKWINTTRSITLKAGERKKLPFTIQIPKNTEPGGYFASIFWGTAPPESDTGGEVAIGGKVGILVLLSVSGPTQQGGGILEASLADGRKLAFGFPMVFSYRFSNDGGTRVKPDGEIKIKNIFGRTVATLHANPRDGNVLPKSVRKFEIPWVTKKQDKFANPTLPKNEDSPGFFGTISSQVRNFALGPYKADIDFTYGQEQKRAEESFYFFVIPWQLLSIVAVILFTGLFGVRRYNHWIISKAKK